MQYPILPEEVNGFEDLLRHSEQAALGVQVIGLGKVVTVVLQVDAVVEGGGVAVARQVVISDVGTALVADNISSLISLR